MSISRPLLFSSMVLLGCNSCSVQQAPPSSATPASTERTAPRPSLPDWLLTQITAYESAPPDDVPAEIWQVQHKGQPAFFVQAPCCDQYNPLLDLAGQELCNPSGGITGGGDEKCPAPADPGTPITFVWAHPAAHQGKYYVPQLGCIECPPLENAALSALPDWLVTRIKRFEHLPAVNSDFTQLWLIQHKGQPAYYAVTGRLYDDLYSASGEMLCKPTGGDDGHGDGKCPWPADPGTEATFVWAHAYANPRDTAVPRLTNQSLFRKQ